ncbi:MULTISPECIES: XisH family protein [unclassified Microcoleus]|uniref:XisH family protein n=1 Tax=unclassified Microcoleus TaxID=2642155 RepID=UPI00312B8A6B
MPAKDIYHDSVKQALINDGWTILKENYELEYGGDNLYPDFAAEKSISAARGKERILVEVKSFIGRSFITDLQATIGQYIMYKEVVEAQNLDFKLYLAVAANLYDNKFQTPLAQLMIQKNQVNLLLFDPIQEVIERWINSNDTEA